jgi:transglutaminase superfamily protein
MVYLWDYIEKSIISIRKTMKRIIIMLMMILVSSIAIGDTCFTVLNSPANDKLYWTAQHYDNIIDNQLNGFLDQTTKVNLIQGLSSGYQYNIRVDSGCFGDNLLIPQGTNGITSETLYIQKNIDDYNTNNMNINLIYTVSKYSTEYSSNKLVKDISTKVIDGVDYAKQPASLKDVIKSKNYIELKNQVCNSNNRIIDQIYIIQDKIWQHLEYDTDGATCSNDANILECITRDKKASNVQYVTLALALAKDCGIPARIAYGISEGSFDGIDIRFKDDKKHYWLEFYDNEWYPIEMTEEGTSRPESTEVNCLNMEDDDDDGMTDCLDTDCSEILFCQGQYPTTYNFDNSYSTNLEILPNVYSIDDLMLGNEFGVISWKDKGIDLRNKNLDSALTISQNRIVLNTNIIELDQPAIVILNNLEIEDPMILIGNAKCAACELLNDGNNVQFSIPGAGTYSITQQDSNIAIQDENNTIINANPTSSNTSYLPAVPVTSGEGKISRIVEQFKSMYNKLIGYSTITKIAIFGALIGLVYLWKKNKKPEYYNG